VVLDAADKLLRDFSQHSSAQAFAAAVLFMGQLHSQ
jgi:hypothetical protein